METQDFALKIKSLDDTSGEFTGFAAIYSDKDLVDDVILPGSFAAAIANQGRGYPLLWSHRSDEPPGIGRIEDDRAGLLLHGKLLLADPAAKRAHLHMKSGAVRGLSIGFAVPKGKSEYRDDGARILKEIRLYEISLTSIPAQPKAQVFDIKNLGSIRHALRSIDTVDDGAVDELLHIHGELERLLAGNDPDVERRETIAELKAFSEKLRRL